ncbi:MAG: bifunctional DNA-binding transcriptional regulator/O6-methylguanine-DNA methyltransferase Ada [Myxococcales bacterium]|nr:bifunctional DNA-binding transcriptional regulator/O6-methylguanine-DNA methyltransferase Ada [Myxococcales bacterium]
MDSVMLQGHPRSRKMTIEGDPRWRALQRRDRSADGTFWYSVSTTGVYCRPSCGARQPRPENVAFHDTPADAQRARFRACKRCRPDATDPEAARVELVADLCRLIEERERTPSLSDLSAHAGLSPSYTQRLFKRVTGVTPRAYCAAHKAARARAALATEDTVTAALHRAGYGSSSRFYDAARGRLGMAPSAFRAGGEALTLTYAFGESSLGQVLVAASPRGVCAILLGDKKSALLADLAARFPHAEHKPATTELATKIADVVALIEEPASGAQLPLDIRGTAFQERVWHALQKVPAGETWSYTALARAVGQPGAARAVAGACAKNPLAVAVPCHRIVRQDGSLSGYRWGLDRKRELLARERKGRRDPSRE